MPTPKCVFVSGATGFIGAHIVDVLLSRGIKVRGSTRSQAKADEMLSARPQWKGLLEFIPTTDFEQGQVDFDEAVAGEIDAIIHVASPFRYDVKSNQDELVLPAINGTKAIFASAAKNPNIQRMVLTSSFAAIIDPKRTPGPDFTYTSQDWNPITYEESINPATSPVIAYRGSKKYAELEAWKLAKEVKFDLVTICPPLVLGPVVHPIHDPANLNESNAQLWKACGTTDAIPEARVPLWIDVRDLAIIHVEALLQSHAGGKRYAAATPEPFSFGYAAKIVRQHFPHRARKSEEGETLPASSYKLDGQTVANELGVEYRRFEDTVVDFMTQMEALEASK